MNTASEFGIMFCFYSLSGLLVIYNLIEIEWLYRKHRKYFFLNPILLAVFANFFIFNGGLTNFMLYEDGAYRINHSCHVLYNEQEWLVTTMGYTCIAAMMTWFGFKFSAGTQMASIFFKTFNYRKVLGDNININLLVGVATIGYLAKVYMLSKGMYGRIVDENLTAVGDNDNYITSQLRYVNSISQLSFVIFSVYFFKYKTRKLKWLFIISLVLELFFAFIYGARSPIVITFLIVVFANYYVSKKMSLAWLLPGALVLYMAFTVILQFKEFILYTGEREYDIVSLLEGFNKYRNNMSDVDKERIYGNIYYNMVHRANYVSEASMAIRYKSMQGLGKGDPSFKKAMIEVPFNVVIPRSISKTKDVSWGNWFRLEVLNQRSDSVNYNIAFSSLGYLFLMGNWLGVITGFFCYGVVLKFTYRTLDHGVLGFLLFLSLVGSVIIFKTAIPGVLTEYIRMVFIFPVIFFLLLKKHDMKEAFRAIMKR
jgi:hypothetical protein